MQMEIAISIFSLGLGFLVIQSLKSKKRVTNCNHEYRLVDWKVKPDKDNWWADYIDIYRCTKCKHRKEEHHTALL